MLLDFNLTFEEKRSRTSKILRQTKPEEGKLIDARKKFELKKHLDQIVVNLSEYRKCVEGK